MFQRPINSDPSAEPVVRLTPHDPFSKLSFDASRSTAESTQPSPTSLVNNRVSEMGAGSFEIVAHLAKGIALMGAAFPFSSFVASTFPESFLSSGYGPTALAVGVIFRGLFSILDNSEQSNRTPVGTPF